MLKATKATSLKPNQTGEHTKLAPEGGLPDPSATLPPRTSLENGPRKCSFVL